MKRQLQGMNKRVDESVANRKVIFYPLSTEKSIRMMEAENKLAFVVDRRSTKPEIRAAIQKMFSVKPTNINTHIMPSGEKRALVTFSKQTPAIDIATNLGMM